MTLKHDYLDNWIWAFMPRLKCDRLRLAPPVHKTGFDSLRWSCTITSTLGSSNEWRELTFLPQNYVAIGTSLFSRRHHHHRPARKAHFPREMPPSFCWSTHQYWLLWRQWRRAWGGRISVRVAVPVQALPNRAWCRIAISVSATPSRWLETEAVPRSSSV